MMSQSRNEVFRSLADPTRRAIFERLCRDGAQSVSTITAQAAISQPAVSKHLRILKGSGLVQGTIHGRETLYRADVAALAPLQDWVREMTGFWDEKFDKLENLLKRMDR